MSALSRPRGARAAGVASVGLPVALSLALGAYELSAPSLWLDEAASVAISSQHGAALGAAMARDGGNMLGYYALLHVLIAWFGNSPLVVRLPSVLGASATVLVLSLLARRIFGNRSALAAGLLAAVSLPLVYYAQDARSYALMMAFVTGSIYATVALLEHDGGGPRRWLALGGLVATTVLAAYMSFVAVLVVPAELVAVAYWRRWSRQTRDWLLGVGIAGACCIPLVVLAARRGTGQLFWVPAPGAAVASQVARALTSSGLTPNFALEPTSTALLAVTIAALVLSTAAILAAGRPGAPDPNGAHGGPRRDAAVSLLALSWLVVPIALEIIESVAAQPILLPRNAMVSLPAVALVIGIAIGHDRLPAPGAFLALGALLVLRGLSLFPTYGTSPEDWRSATAHVLSSRRPGDCVAFYPEDARMPFAYYLTRLEPSARSAAGAAALGHSLRPVLPSAPWNETTPFVEEYSVLSAREVAAVAASCPRLWVVASHQGSTHGTETARRHEAGYLALMDGFSGVYRARTGTAFGYAAPVDVTLFRDAVPSP